MTWLLLLMLADVQDLQGAAWMHYELTYAHEVDGDAHPTDFILASARLHGFVGEGANVGFHAGFDLAGGSTLAHAGFAYDVALLPIGVGVRGPRNSFIALGTGVEWMGAVGALDDATLLPVELTFEYGGGVRLLGRARIGWVAGADGRHDGARDLPFTDELDAMLGVRLGKAYDDYGFPSGNGYFIGAAYRELLGARFVGVTLGYAIDIGSKRRYLGHFPRRVDR
jgi:hypothetical protein